jgi:UDP-N-acetylglucosamine 2-epimerase (non-hydrolysing)
MRPILMVIGTRPEAIKMLPVARALRAAGLPLFLVTTGQHRSMLDQVFAIFGETADQDLALMTPGQTLTEVTARVLQRMDELYAAHQPSLVLVHGDTTTAMAAALAAFYARIPIGHVEAGLRSHDMARPYPEELNRVAIDAVADLLFAPTEGAAANLRRETPRERAIHVTGNTGIDALLHVAGGLRGDELDGLKLPLDAHRPLVLVTGHRRESFGNGFVGICEGLARIGGRGDVDLVYPVHLNPEVQRCVGERLAGLPNIHLIEPVDYVAMVALMRRARLILTDSGGIQEEAPALGRPVLVMREVTERPEAVACGTASLVGTDPARIESEAARLLDDDTYYAGRARPAFPFGDGRAAERIAAAIGDHLKDHS